MKSRNKILVFTVAFLAVTVPTILGAQETPKTNYGVVKIGGFIPQSSDLDKENAGNGFSGQIGFGYYLNRYFSLECDLGYFETKGNVGDTSTKFQVIPLEISGRLGLPLGLLEPYVVGGLGGYRVDAKAGNRQKTSYPVGFFGGGGVNLNLGERVYIGIEGRYLVLAASAPYPTPYSSSSGGDLDLNGVIVTGNLGFRF